MNRKMQFWRDWLLAGTMAAGMIAGSGCASQKQPAPSAANEDALQTPVQPAVAAAPTINLFGQFAGMKSIDDATPNGLSYAQHSFSREGTDSGVVIDPAGQWMCYASTRHSMHTDLYLQRVNGLSVIQLTSGGADNASPAFSPDGKRIAFCSTRAGSWDLYVMDADGRNVVQLTDGPAQDMHPSFSPDGNQLVYCSMPLRGGEWELWVLDLRNQSRKMIGTGLFPNWSPQKDVNRIAFQRARGRGSHWFSLWTLDLVNGEATRQMEVAASTNAAIISPCWSPDGKRLAFSTVVDPVTAQSAGQQDIWVVDADGANRRRLTDGRGSNLTPFWSGDNQVYFISDRGGNANVWSTKFGQTPTMTAAAE